MDGERQKGVCVLFAGAWHHSGSFFMGGSLQILRFAARMDTVKQEDVERRFIVSYYLADDTVAVYETPARLVSPLFFSGCAREPRASSV